VDGILQSCKQKRFGVAAAAESDNTASRFGLRHWRFSDRHTAVIDRFSSTIKEANHTRIVNFLARHGRPQAQNRYEKLFSGLTSTNPFMSD
jgi:hypothetical protein